MNDRNRHTNKEINCMVGDKDEKEDIYHFILHCTAYNEERSHSTHTTAIYIESDEDILGHFLFDKEDFEERKKIAIRYMEKKTTSNEDNINTIVRFKSEIAIQLCLVMVNIPRRNQHKI